MSQRFAAVDVGASSGRVITGHLEAGRLLTEEVARFTNGPVPVSQAGRQRLHWDVLGLWDGIRTGLRAAGASGPVASVGVDTWAVDYGLLDADGALLGNPVHYRDARTDGAPERLFAALPAAEHYATTGLQVQPFNTVFQLVSAGGTAQLAAAQELLLIPDLFGHWLTGASVAEVTNASTTGLLDARTRRWSDPVLAVASQLAGRDLAALLPRLVEPGTVIAPLLGDVARELALPGAELVSVGTHDTASAVAAVPMADPSRSAYISSGTWSLVGLELDEPVLTEGSRRANVTNELGVAGTVRYLRNVSGLWLLQESLRTWAQQGAPQDLGALLAAAAQVPGLRTVVDVDDPVFATPGDVPQRIAETAQASGQPVPQSPPEIARCILDSLALGYRRAIRAVAEHGRRRVDVVHIVGGGARNPLLCRLTAEATGLPVIAGPGEATAIGNLLTQAWATGALPGGLPRIREVVRASTELTRWEPAGNDQAWDQAETRLRNNAATN